MDEFRLVLERGRLQWHQRYSRESEEDLGSRYHFVQQVRLNVTIITDIVMPTFFFFFTFC